MLMDDDAPRDDVEDGLRFVANAAMKYAHDRARIEALARTLVRVLVENRTLDLALFERHLGEAVERPPPPPDKRVRLSVAPEIDKHTIRSPDVDCVALFPICKARCCMLHFSLTPDEVDSRNMAWSYVRPYDIAHGADHRCVHQDRATGGCTVYDERPGICRKYDCRKDPRVWEDFEKRIPAPLERITAPRTPDEP
jgi:Fe-S-cluster containining protein